MKLPLFGKKLRGFTLVELLIVIAIISILISIGLASFRRVQMQSRDRQRQAALTNIQGALEQYYSDYNEYPASLNDLTSAPNSEVYIRAIPIPPTIATQANYSISPGSGQTYCVGAIMEIGANNTSCGGTNYGFVITQAD